MRLRWKDYELDEERLELRCEGAPVRVQPKVLDLLIFLVRARERVVLKRELFETIWAGTTVSEASLSRAILEARRAIGDDLQQVLVTVRGRGFRFSAPVVAHADVAPPEPPSSASNDPTFVGRDSCMRALEARLEQTVGGRGGVVWIAGDAGIGKTRAADEFARRARARGIAVYSVTAHAAPPPPPFWLWGQVGREVAASADDQPLAAELTMTLDALARGANAGGDDAKLPLFDAFARSFVAAARARPRVIVLDDVHWADDRSLRLLSFLLREIRNAPVLVVGTYRDAAADDLRTPRFARLLGDSTGLVISLRGLSLLEVPRFVDVATGATPSTAFCRALHERTGGSPLFLQQLLKTEWAERALDETASVIASSMDLQQGMIESIRRHVDVVSSEVRQLLGTATLIGREFDVAKLALVAGLPSSTLLDHLDQAARARILVKSKKSAYRFTHPLVRDVLYKSMSGADRAMHHARIADTLLAHYAGSLDAHIEEVAMHATRGLPRSDPERALDLCIRAASLATTSDTASARWDDAAQALAHVSAVDPRHVVVALGSAHARARLGDEVTAREGFLGATTLARTFGEPEALADAALGYAALANGKDPVRQALLAEAWHGLTDARSEGALRLRRLVGVARAASEPEVTQTRGL